MLIRAGMTAIPGAVFLLFAALFWLTKPTNDGSLVGAIFTAIFAGSLAILGVAGLAIGIPSAIFGALVLTRKRWAQWTAAIGEILIAIALLGTAVWGLTHPNDQVLVLPVVVVMAVAYAPVVVLLLLGLTKRES